MRFLTSGCTVSLNFAWLVMRAAEENNSLQHTILVVLSDYTGGTGHNKVRLNSLS